MNLKPLVVALALTSMTPFADEKKSVDEVIVVTATQGEQSLISAPASVSVVDFEELIKLPATDITNSLKDVVGVNVRVSGNGERAISLRGLNPSYTLLLVNGRRVNSREALIRGAFDLSSIPMTAIERIEVVRGPMSALYGSEAIGGVVNVILKQADDHWQVNGNIDHDSPIDGGGELTRTGVFARGALIENELYLSIGANISDREPWQPEDSQYGLISKTEKQERTGFNASLSWLASEHDKITIDSSIFNEDKSYKLWPGRDGNVAENLYESERVNFGLQHQREWLWGQSELSYYFEETDIQEDNARLDFVKGTQTNNSFAGKAVFGTDTHLLTAGFDYADNSLEHPRDFSNTADNQQTAVYLQDEWSVSDELVLTLSGRFTEHSEFGSNFSPRAYAVYQANEDLTFKGGIATGFKAPAMWRSNQGFSTISCGGRCVLVGNSELEPETSVSYEFATIYEFDSGFVRATLFSNTVEDLIARDTANFIGETASGEPKIQHININEVRSQGLEFDAQVSVTNQLDVVFNFTHTDSEDKSDGQPLLATPEQQVNLKLNWAVTDAVGLYGALNYIGEQYIEMAPTWEKTPASGYSLVNVGGNYRFNETFAIRYGVRNLFDKRLDLEDVDYGYAEVGRSYFAGLDFNF